MVNIFSTYASVNHQLRIITNIFISAISVIVIISSVPVYFLG